MDCEYIRYYKEPNEKYVCMSLSLFILDKYIKRTKNNKPIDVLSQKIDLFFKNMVIKLKHLLNNVYPNNYYMRIYYDDSVYTNDKIKKLFDVIKDYKKIQLIKFNCPKYKKNNINHIGLFGTVMRFHALFDNDSPNMEMCVFIDADTIYTKKYIEEVEHFRKSNNLVLTFGNIYQMPIYFMDEKINIMDYNLLDKTHFPAGLVAIKRNSIFNFSYWNKYVDNMFNQYDLLLQYNYLDFKRFGMKNETDYDKQSYYSFSYGFDECWLNFIIKNILKKTNNENKLKVILFKSTNIKFIRNRLFMFMEYNNNRNKTQFNLFLKNCDFLKEKNIHSLKKYMNSIHDQHHLNLFFNKIKNNQYFNNIYIQNIIKYIILEYNKLINLDMKYKQNDLFIE